jgi:two-component system sensor histidine kinase PhcS
MSESQTEYSAAFRSAFAANEQQELISTGKVACALVVFLMPLGTVLDHYVYPDPDRFIKFLVLRLICSLLVGIIWILYFTPFGEKHYRALGLPIAWLPSFFIAWMIYDAPDPAFSPYYAGLNLVLLAISVVVHWSTFQSILAVGGVHLMYLGVCLARDGLHGLSLIVSNYYFLALTGIIVIVGNHFFNRLRFREFALRYELDAEKRKTDLRNRELADAYQKLTEQESQIVQSQKLASIGQMSAGIIHEINNPLNFATTGLFSLKKKSKHLPAEQRAEYDDIVKDIEDGIGRVKNIVSDLRTFTHPNTDILDQVLVSDVVASALRFLSNEVKDKAVIERKLPTGQTVLANKNKLIHLFVNLIKNSLDALRTKPFPNGEQPTIWIEGREENGSNYLIVRDNGPGIPIDLVDKIYDPFFTTKAVGEGMGLGLSMCARIMKDSQGKISVRTEKGKYCEFTLEFPEPT